MPKQKSIGHKRDHDADELLFRALRQLADEALEEEIPERLLRLVRTAERQHAAEGEGPAGPSEPVEKAGEPT